MSPYQAKIAVIIPSYKVTAHILDVLARIGPEVAAVYVVDDCCPEGSGDLVEAHCIDSRVKVIRHQVNGGVGAAVITGYMAALDDGMDIMVKIDGDGQMDPGMVPDFVAPILAGEADYTKGNRFFDLEQIQAMPTIRLFGNAVLSFFNKISSGYWNLFDPTNGYTALHRDVARSLPFARISERYFFESDMLFRLNTLQAVVVDIPMNATYGDEVSNLRISKVAGEFFKKHIKNTCKRIFYNYYLRDLSLASLQLPLGACSRCSASPSVRVSGFMAVPRASRHRPVPSCWRPCRCWWASSSSWPSLAMIFCRYPSGPSCAPHAHCSAS